MAKEVQLPQTDEKTETYLLTNKGMEKLDIKKEIQPLPEKVESPINRRTIPKGRETGGLSNRDSSPVRDRGIPEVLAALRDKRQSWKTLGQDSNIEGVE